MTEKVEEPEMLDGLKILLDRMEMFPEEFVPDYNQGDHRWARVFQYGYAQGVLTDDEKKILEAALVKARRKVFSQRVAANVLYLNDSTLAPKHRKLKPSSPTPSLTPYPNQNIITVNPHITTTSSVTVASGTAGGGGTGNTYTVTDKTGYKILLQAHEYQYLMRQDKQRQESYLNWIKRGRP